VSRKKYLLITVAIFLGCTVYLCNSNITASVDVSSASHNDINQYAPKKPLIADKNQKSLTNSELQTLECPALKQANKRDKNSKAAFISTKAIQWYFAGHDKYKIAETLAAMFNYSIAMKWIEDVNGLSQHHEKHSQLIQEISSISYTDEFSISSNVIPNISSYKLSTIYGKELDIDQQFNQYPDLAIYHWNVALKQALLNGNIEDVINAINELKTYNTNPIFFQHPLNNFGTFLHLSSFKQPEINKITRALFDLSPVFIASENGNRIERRLKQKLVALAIDKSLWKFEQLRNDSFETSPNILKLINKTNKESPLLVKQIAAEKFCGKDQVKKIITIKMTAIDAKKTLTPAWQGVHSLHCNDRTFLNVVLSIKRKLNVDGIPLKNLGDFEGLQKYSEKLEQTIKQLDANEQATLFSHLYINKAFEVGQIKDLISLKITPTNSDLYMLLRLLPFEQQKKLLMEYQYDLVHFNRRGMSIITNALIVSSGTDNYSDELIPFLIAQGFPLKESQSSPDPLWIQLSILSADNSDEKLPIKTISSLIEHTKLNETHVDIMYSIKLEHIELYQALIEEFPALKFVDPEQLTQIECS